MTLTTDEFEVLHAVALRKRTDLEGLVRSTGLARGDVEAALGRAAEAKLVLVARRNYFVTPEGDRALRSAYADRFGAIRADGGLATDYARFEEVNREVKAIVTDWQVRPVGGQMLPNDHSDSAYDEGVLDRLAQAHERAGELLAGLARRVPRLGRYGERLAAALERAEAGEGDWVSGVRCDSYHTVWFELHEDLLRMLDRQREE
jgi:hypothetical protein